jgi:hypothetical protein
VRFPDPVTLVRPAGSDPFGDPLPGEAGRTSVAGVFAPGSTSEDLLGRGATAYTTATLYLPVGTDVRRTDRVEVRGTVWEVDGEPVEWRSPGTGRRAGLQVNLRAVKG